MFKSVLLVLLLALPGVTVAQTQQSITVSGQGSSTSVPDQFSFTAVVEERGESVSKLHTTVSAKVAQIVEQLLDAGIEQRHIQSMQLSLSPWYERTPAGSRQNGYVLNRQVNVTVTNLDDYARIVDRVLKAGAARFENFSFGVADPERDYQVALERAVTNARARAQVLAKQADVELAEVLSISQHAGYNPMPRQRSMMMAQESQADLPGQIVTSTSVQVVFAIKPRNPHP